MTKKNTATEIKAGWEYTFTIPRFVAKPLNLYYALLFIIALMLIYILITNITGKIK